MDIYVVVENGDPYLKVFRTYSEAISAVKEKHAVALEEDFFLSKELSCPVINTVDSQEKEDGKTYLYIEKGIHIYVYRLSF
jgi:hypothetical protein